MVLLVKMKQKINKKNKQLTKTVSKSIYLKDGNKTKNNKWIQMENESRKKDFEDKR